MQTKPVATSFIVSEILEIRGEYREIEKNGFLGRSFYENGTEQVRRNVVVVLKETKISLWSDKRGQQTQK